MASQERLGHTALLAAIDGNYIYKFGRADRACELAARIGRTNRARESGTDKGVKTGYSKHAQQVQHRFS